MQTNANSLILAVAGNCWTARYVGPHAAGIKSLFGTDTLPLPYDATYPAEKILAQTKAKNSNITISLAMGPIEAQVRAGGPNLPR